MTSDNSKQSFEQQMSGVFDRVSGVLDDVFGEVKQYFEDVVEQTEDAQTNVSEPSEGDNKPSYAELEIANARHRRTIRTLEALLEQKSIDLARQVSQRNQAQAKINRIVAILDKE